MNKYLPFSKKQADYIKRSAFCWLNVAEGGKRAGKNIINIISFAMSLERHADKIHLVGGVTIGSAKMNIIDSNGFGLKHYFKGRCREGRYEGRDALIVDTACGEKVIIIAGGGLCNAAVRIKGNSYGMAYISEVNECHQTFFQEVLDRTLASSDRRLFFDLNPKPPGHWFYREFLDLQDELKAKGKNDGYNYGHFIISDNLSISDEKLNNVLKTYDRTSIWFQADILGKRMSAVGRIYEGFNYKDIVVDRADCLGLEYEWFSIGIDIGGTDATVATLIGITKGHKEAVVIDGYYHKQGKESAYTHDAYAKAIVNKICEWSNCFENFLFCCNIFCESADKLFRQALVNELTGRGMRITVYASYKNGGILDRIRLVNIIINQRRFKISAHLEKWIEAFESATWNEKERSRGEWVRTDDGSYPLDCLDSLEYAVVPFKNKLLVYKCFKIIGG